MHLCIQTRDFHATNWCCPYLFLVWVNLLWFNYWLRNESLFYKVKALTRINIGGRLLGELQEFNKIVSEYLRGRFIDTSRALTEIVISNKTIHENFKNVKHVCIFLQFNILKN